MSTNNATRTNNIDSARNQSVKRMAVHQIWHVSNNIGIQRTTSGHGLGTMLPLLACILLSFSLLCQYNLGLATTSDLLTLHFSLSNTGASPPSPLFCFTIWCSVLVRNCSFSRSLYLLGYAFGYSLLYVVFPPRISPPMLSSPTDRKSVV